MENTYNFTDYLLDNNFNQITPKFFTFENNTIKIIGDRFIAMNLDKKIKHKHIVTAKIPKSLKDANVVFQSCGIFKGSNKVVFGYQPT